MIFAISFFAGIIILSAPAVAVFPPDGGDKFVDEAFTPNPDAAISDEAPFPTEERETARPNLFQSGIRMMTSLIIVIGIILLIAYGAKRFLSRKGALPGKESMIRILATRYLGSKNSLSVVDVDGERFVIALSPQGISFLTALCNVSGTDEVNGGESSFRKVLRKSLHEE